MPKIHFNPLDMEVLMTNSMQSFVLDPHKTISATETCNQDFQVILKRLLENLEEMFPWYY